MNGFDRRRFLATSGVLLLPAVARVAEPIAGREAPKFKLSLAAYSFRKQLTPAGGEPAEMDLHDFIDRCAELGLDGAELTGYYMPDPPPREYLHALQAHCFRLGLAVSGTAIRCDFGWPEDAPERARELAHVRRWIDAAAELRAPVIRIFAGHAKPGVDAERTGRLMVEGIAESCRYAGQRGVYLGLENHGGPTQTAEGLLRLVRAVDSPWLGVNLDTGNFRGGGDPYQQMAEAAPYAVNVQVKVMLHDAAGKKQPTDFARLAEVLREANYRGFVVLEYEEGGDVHAGSRQALDRLRAALASS